jgi:hypothetical protein
MLFYYEDVFLFAGPSLLSSDHQVRMIGRRFIFTSNLYFLFWFNRPKAFEYFMPSTKEVISYPLNNSFIYFHYITNLDSIDETFVQNLHKKSDIDFVKSKI